MKDHARQLLEKYVGKPFLDPEQARYGDEGSRMGAEDVEEGLAWLDDRFHVIRYEDDELPSVDWVLDLARAAVLRQVSCTLAVCPVDKPAGLPDCISVHGCGPMVKGPPSLPSHRSPEVSL